MIRRIYNILIVRDVYDIVRDLIRKTLLVFINFFPGSPGNRITDYVKGKFLKLLNIQVGLNCQISSGFYVFNFGKVKFGNYCRIGSNFKVWNFTNLIVGELLLASHNVTIICGTHTVDNLRTNIAGPILIGNNVWIGANVLIVGPANIGDNTIIAANSFVTGTIPPNTVFGGSPARLIKNTSS